MSVTISKARMAGSCASVMAWVLACVTTFAASAQAQGQAQVPLAGGAPLDFVVIFPAGSSADVSARILADGIAKHLDQAVPVSNKPGGGGAIGYKYVAAARPDGRTMVWNSNSLSTTFHSGAMDIDYKAFEPVARVSIEIPAVVVQSSSKWKTLAELLDYARANPGMLKVGNSGTGSHTHMAAAALFEAAGAKVLDVPFSATQVVPSLLGGHVDALIQLPGAVVPHVKSGALRVLGCAGVQAGPGFPRSADSNGARRQARSHGSLARHWRPQGNAQAGDRAPRKGR